MSDEKTMMPPSIKTAMAFNGIGLGSFHQLWWDALR